MSDIRYYTDGTPATAANLNKPLEDLEKQSQYMSQAQYESLAEMRRNAYAGSGYMHASAGWWTNINGIGCLTRGHSQQESYGINKFYLGSETKDGNLPFICNVNGNKHRVSFVNNFDENISNRIKLPDASTLNGIETNLNSLSKEFKQGDMFILNDNSELIPNSVFTTLTNITINSTSNGTATIVDNKLRVTCGVDNANARAIQPIGKIIKGVKYKIEIDGLDSTNCSVGHYLYLTEHSNGSNTGAFPSTTISENMEFTADRTTDLYLLFGVRYNATAGEYVELSSFSLKPVEQYNTIVVKKDLLLGDNLQEDGNKVEKIDSISRQDLVFLESWHELISEKDFVYPLGNVQNRKASNSSRADGVLTIGTPIDGTFSGFETYSLFGNWQEEGSLIGRGYVWSNLSSESKIKFAQNPENNIYMSNDGLVQVRYRIRVVKGLGNDWLSVGAQSDGIYGLGYFNWSDGFGASVAPKGAKTSVVEDLKYISDSDDGHYHFLRGNRDDMGHSDILQLGAYKISGYDSNGDYCYNNHNYAMPIALVQRRNKGAFDPVHNPEGSSVFSDGKKWYETSASHNSIIDCFNNAGDGDIASGISGRPDGLFFDEVNERDVEDLRMSAHKVTDKQSYLNEQFNKAVKGDFRGTYNYKSNIKYGTSSGDIGRLYLPASTKLFSGDIIKFQVINPGKSDMIIDEIFQDTVKHYDYNNAFIKIPSDKYGTLTSGTVGMIFRIIDTDFRDEELIIKNNYTQNNNALYCDIIGDSSLYPSEWKENFPIGSPIFYDDRKNSLKYEDMTRLSANYNGYSSDNVVRIPLSKRADSIKLVVNGNNYWTSFPNDPSGWTDAANRATAQDSTNILYQGWSSLHNEAIFDLDQFDLTKPIQIFYEGSVDFAYGDINRSVESLTDVRVGIKNHGSYYSHKLVQSLLNKVPEWGSYSSTPTRKLNINSFSNTNVIRSGGHHPTHGQFDEIPHVDAIGCKFFGYLTKDNNRSQMNIVFKEMKWDIGSDSMDDIVEANPSVAFDIEVGSLVRLNGFDNTVVNGLVLVSRENATGKVWQTNSWDGYYIDSNNILRNHANNISWNIWNGNGWGDNNKFEIISRTGVMNDDNTQAILYGQKTIKLPNFLD